MKAILLILWITLSIQVYAPPERTKLFKYAHSPKWLIELIEYNKIINTNPYDPLVVAIDWVESGGGKCVYNPKENAVGRLQIRQCRVDHYNQLKRTHYKLKDFFNYALSREMFLFFAKGKSYEWAARRWNGSGPMTIVYWNKVKAKLKTIKMNISPRTKEAYELMHQGILALARAEQQGIRVDVPYVQKKMEFLTRRINRLEADFKDTQFYKDWEKATPPGKLNINSPTQLSNFLYKVKGITPPKFTKSSTEENPKGSSDKETLKQLGIPDLDILFKKNKLTRLRDTNLDGYLREQVNGYIHPFFNLHIPRSFRSSSSAINFQNQPIHDEESMKICRGALYPRPGHQLLELDYSGIEFRTMACYNKDQVMLDYINDPKSDVHGDMAKIIFDIENFDKKIPSHATLRQAAKNGFIFPQLYGDFYKNCAGIIAINWVELPKSKWRRNQGLKLDENICLSDHFISNGIRSFDSFINHLERVEKDFRSRFSGHWEWKERWNEAYQKCGYIDSLTGFRYNGVMNQKEIVSYPNQGSAFHCLLWALIQIDKMIIKQGLDSKIIGQIHDSIVFDINPSELQHVAKVAKSITCELLPKMWDWIITPLDVDMAVSPVDKSWAEKEKFKIG